MRTLSYRLFLGLAVLAWVCVASTMCGCRAGSAYMANRSGRSEFNKGNYTAARRKFEQSLADQPWNADYAYNVGSAMDHQGDSLAAERMYLHALTIDPTHQPSYAAMRVLLHKQGREDEAEELALARVETQPYDPEANIDMAWMRQQQGDYPAAESSLRQALRKNPGHPRALARLGQVYERQGRHQEAIAMYRQSLAINPAQPLVHERLQAVYARNVPASSLAMAQQMPYYDPTLAAFPVPTAAMRRNTMVSANPYGYGMSPYQSAYTNPYASVAASPYLSQASMPMQGSIAGGTMTPTVGYAPAMTYGPQPNGGLAYQPQQQMVSYGTNAYGATVPPMSPYAPVAYGPQATVGMAPTLTYGPTQGQSMVWQPTSNDESFYSASGGVTVPTTGITYQTHPQMTPSPYATQQYVTSPTMAPMYAPAMSAIPTVPAF